MLAPFLGASLLALSLQACPNDAEKSCTIAGCSRAFSICAEGQWLPCKCSLEPQPGRVAYIDGKYMVAAVWYTPPGPGSFTSYAVGTTTGTSVTSQTQHSNTFTVSIGGKLSFIGLTGVDYTTSFTNTWTQTSTTAIDHLMTSASNDQIPGPGTDTLDHNYDQIVLALGPTLIFQEWVDGWGAMKNLTWGVDMSRAVLYPVRVGELNGSLTMPTPVADTLGLYGVTPDVYDSLLGATAYAHDPAGILPPPPERYECVATRYYRPDIPNTTGYAISNKYSSSNTVTTSHKYDVKLSLGGTWLHQNINATDVWSWSNQSSTRNSLEQSGAAQLTLKQPSSAYSGPTILYVYVDMVYKTLLYSFAPPRVATAACPAL